MSEGSKKSFIPKIPTFSSPWMMGGTLVVIVITIIAASYFFIQYRNAQKLLANPEVKTQKESEELVSKVGKIYALPQGDPTIATVSDRDKLQSQQFFASAQNGDKVLIYTDAKKAILYRPSTGQVIEVGPITIQDQQAASGSAGVAGVASEKTTVAVYNGTARTGLTRTASDKIALIETFSIGERTNAVRKDYAETLVIDVSGSKSTEAEELATLVGGTIAELPEGETEPEADLLVILGENYQE